MYATMSANAKSEVQGGR